MTSDNVSKQVSVIEPLMPRNLDMMERARNPYMVYYEDGLLDVYLGLALLMFGVVLLTDYPAFAGLAFAILYPILMAAKQDIAAPRIRPGALSPAQVASRMRSTTLTLGVALAMGVLLFALRAQILPARIDNGIGSYLPTVILVVIAGLLVAWGLQTGTIRLFFYAGLILIARLASYWLDIELPHYAIALGVSLTLIGLAVTIRFIRDHPKDKQAA
jgi:hypothetical protein